MIRRTLLALPRRWIAFKHRVCGRWKKLPNDVLGLQPSVSLAQCEHAMARSVCSPILATADGTDRSAQCKHADIV